MEMCFITKIWFTKKDVKPNMGDSSFIEQLRKYRMPMAKTNADWRQSSFIL